MKKRTPPSSFAARRAVQSAQSEPPASPRPGCLASSHRQAAGLGAERCVPLRQNLQFAKDEWVMLTPTILVFERRPRWVPELERQFAGEEVRVRGCGRPRDIEERLTPSRKRRGPHGIGSRPRGVPGGFGTADDPHPEPGGHRGGLARLPRVRMARSRIGGRRPSWRNPSPAMKWPPSAAGNFKRTATH